MEHENFASLRKDKRFRDVILENKINEREWIEIQKCFVAPHKGDMNDSSRPECRYYSLVCVSSYEELQNMDPNSITLINLLLTEGMDQSKF